MLYAFQVCLGFAAVHIRRTTVLNLPSHDVGILTHWCKGTGCVQSRLSGLLAYLGLTLAGLKGCKGMVSDATDLGQYRNVLLD